MAVNNGAMTAAFAPKVGGGVYYAPGTPTLPVDASTALNAAFKALGPISQDGIKPSRDTSVDKVKEWDGSTLASLLSDESRSFEFLMYGAYDEDVLSFVYGAANVSVTAATASVGTKIAVTDKGGKPANGSLVFEMVYGGKKKRIVVPVADSVITGEEPYVKGGLTGYTVTVEALKNASGVRVYEYLENDNPTG